LFSQGPGAAPAPAAATAAAPPSSVDLFSTAASPPRQAAAPPAAPTGYPCYDGNGLHITIQTQRNAEGMIQAIAKFRNTGAGSGLSNVGLQAAVPKSQKLQLLSISSTDLAPGAEATQAMRVAGCKGVSSCRFCVWHF